ncbi:helix-turn-helix domain-containing protein [Rhizobium favelukesii]|uniref:helix-turn-helix domain-containing protein n=1 Tax=Rhizobium favelukesii TaxID=348824 RepID=UPI002160D373|nr:helix-turn-helix domain-containing protein [Rhizobium favelukesii]MCS0459516.1 hypothetical protein [Rhizobium favelukesii]
MIVTAREFTSVAEMRAAAAAVHARCLNLRAKPKPALVLVAPQPRPPVPTYPKPIWKREPTLFAEHITAYQVILRLREMQAHGELEMVEFERRSMLEIVMEVLVDFPGISVTDINSGRRTKKVCVPRAIAMYEVKKQRPDLSFPAIGRWFGGRDHTTVLYSVRKIEALRGEA